MGERKGPQLGISVNTETGESSRATEDGIKHELKRDIEMGEELRLPNTHHNRNMVADLLKKNGYPEEAAKLLGEEYKDSLVSKFVKVTTTSASVADIFVITVIAGVSYLVLRWGLKKTTRALGWNWFGWNPAMEEVNKTTNVRSISRATA